jgi:hypothetical protein
VAAGGVSGLLGAVRGVAAWRRAAAGGRRGGPHAARPPPAGLVISTTHGGRAAGGPARGPSRPASPTASWLRTQSLAGLLAAVDDVALRLGVLGLLVVPCLLLLLPDVVPHPLCGVCKGGRSEGGGGAVSGRRGGVAAWRRAASIRRRQAGRPARSTPPARRPRHQHYTATAGAQPAGQHAAPPGQPAPRLAGCALRASPVFLRPSTRLRCCLLYSGGRPALLALSFTSLISWHSSPVWAVRGGQRRRQLGAMRGRAGPHASIQRSCFEERRRGSAAHSGAEKLATASPDR